MAETIEEFTYGNPHRTYRLEAGKRYRLPRRDRSLPRRPGVHLPSRLGEADASASRSHMTGSWSPMRRPSRTPGWPSRIGSTSTPSPTALWGVIEGCVVTVSGTTASMTPAAWPSSTACWSRLRRSDVSPGCGRLAGPLRPRSPSTRAGTLQVVVGTLQHRPRLPRPADDVTVLAAVFAPATAEQLLRQRHRQAQVPARRRC